MYSVKVPQFPEILVEEDCIYSSFLVPGFAGLQERNGPYGEISSEKHSNGQTDFRAEEEDIPKEEFKKAIQWIADNSSEILDKALMSMMDYYEEMKDIIHEDYEPSEAVKYAPEISSHEDLASLCGVSSVFILDVSKQSELVFGIEFGCTWEEEHGAGVQFRGLQVIESGGADVSFCYYPEDI